MLQNTKGIVLRSVKYGDTSIITTIFTSTYGVQSYIVQGVRTAKAKNNRAGLLQPSSLLDLVVYHKPQNNLNRLREFQPAYIYGNLQEEIVKNSIALFSVEVLLRLLPEHACMPELFDMVFEYFCWLDKKTNEEVANLPVYFVIACGRLLGYEINGNYTSHTPYLNLEEGAFTTSAPAIRNYLHDDDSIVVSRLLAISNIDDICTIDMNAAMRNRVLDWYIDFLHRHTQHLGSIKSLAVLREILH